MMAGILSYGSYLPMRRLPRQVIADATSWFNGALSGLGRGERSVANWDEDTLTMAVEACRNCLPEAGRDAIGQLVLASTTLPFADRQNAGIAKEALLLSDRTHTLDITGSQRGGTSGLIAALEATVSGKTTLLAAADRRHAPAASAAQMINGDAGAALLVGPGEPLAELVCARSMSVDFVDRFRASDARHDYEWEGRWIREEGYMSLVTQLVTETLGEAGLRAEEVDHFLFETPMPGVEARLAKALGIRAGAVARPLFLEVGYTGCAHPLLQLAATLERATAGEVICLVGFGQGCDVLLLRVIAANDGRKPAARFQDQLARRKVETNYTRFLYFSGELEFEEGMRAELDIKTPPSMLYRDRKTILGLVGGKCRETGVVQYPRSDVSVAGNARTRGTQEDYPLADRIARVRSFTADYLAYSPDPPSCYGIVEFEGGGRMIADFTDLPEPSLEVGQAVRMVFRLKRTDQRGFRHYFWKAVPVTDQNTRRQD